MSITMQGSWTLRVKTQGGLWPQRFIISGADSGNGTYAGTVGSAVYVTGAHWAINIQHQARGQSWLDSAQRIGLPSVNAGLLSFEIASSDSGVGLDFDDLVLGASLPASASDYVVYGNVKTYSGPAPINPYRDDYIVIDPPFKLAAICARYPQLGAVIERLYPGRLRESRALVGDEELLDVTPIVLPTGLPNPAVGLVFQSRLARAPEPWLAQGATAAHVDEAEAEAIDALQTVVRRVPFQASGLGVGVARLARSELAALGEIRDATVRLRYHLERAPRQWLRFQHYERTVTERHGGPYSGMGARQDLGLAVTDGQGNYLFRFSPPAGDGATAAQPRPDLIVQALGSDLTLRFETAPYDHVTNLRRIDLCVPQPHVQTRQVGASERMHAQHGDAHGLHPRSPGLMGMARSAPAQHAA